MRLFQLTNLAILIVYVFDHLFLVETGGLLFVRGPRTTQQQHSYTGFEVG